MSLPHILLTDSQSHLLAELLLAPLPVREGSSRGPEVNEEDSAARGLDHDTTLVDLSRLIAFGLVVHEAGSVQVTDLGMAVHYEKQLGVAQSHLGDVVRFATAVEGSHPRLAQTLRLLAQGEISLRTAVTDAVSTEQGG
ncbi:hypothetical protein [Streptomyces sp. MH60]|uniref:hypothetical protein n=1 Tax=Streptomyces sp. MH60 TaxID=1940758 RepID=UPI000CEE012C|nr:hypothetical protein [Streptomyces sp. MH60]PPS88086.1 hypothetical protein BZZ08_02509 [Streptomyces sp. MH60]